MKIAVRFARSIEMLCNPIAMRRQEMPASRRRCVSPQESNAAFPEEPLARVYTVAKMRYLALQCLEKSVGKLARKAYSPTVIKQGSRPSFGLANICGRERRLVLHLDGLNISTESLQLFDDVFIAAFDIVDLTDLALALGG